MNIIKGRGAAPVTGITLRTRAGGLSAVNAIGTHLRNSINSRLTR